ncbi:MULTISPECIES: carbamoyltransferase family protein [unclassified Nocardiopsis]|uniref:carbamoyltransferase family protein n=1 Tax=Nocardiopsis TaxID=2013 RepID=UPI00387AAD3B
MRVLGVNAVFRDPAAALVVDGRTVAAAEEERFSRRRHGKDPVPFSTWELPVQAMLWCLEEGDLAPSDLDVVTYSYHPDLADPEGPGQDADWEHLRLFYVERAAHFLAQALPGLDRRRVVFVPHHVAHAASAVLAAPPFEGGRDAVVFAADGRGESTSHLVGASTGGRLEVLSRQPLPDSLGLVYEELSEHLGFGRSGDEDEVVALACKGEPSMLGVVREHLRFEGGGRVRARALEVPWDVLAPRRDPGAEPVQEHADLAASVQEALEETILGVLDWAYERTRLRRLTMAGGVAFNCAANSRVHRDGPFDDVWVQPAAGDAGTALGGALYAAAKAGDDPRPMPGADLGRSWDEHEVEALLCDAGVAFERSADLPAAVAAALADNALVAWFQGRAEFGPRALGRRCLLAHPGDAANLHRLSRVTGRGPFGPVSPMVVQERAPEIFFDGPLPSPYGLFAHRVARRWRGRLPAVVNANGTARVQTVSPASDPLTARVLAEFEGRTGLPVLAGTGLATPGRPMVDSPWDALECFGSAPVDVLAIGPFLVRRRR